MDEWLTVLDSFALFQRGANLSEKTIQNRQECLLRVATMSQKSPRKVTEEDLLRVLGRPHARQAGGISAGTKQSERSYMQVFFKWLKRTKRRDNNPAKDLPKVKVPRRTPRPLTAVQIEAMADSGAYQRTRDIILIAALTGLRIGEIVAIRGEDVDLVGMTIRSLRKGNLDHRIGLHPVIAELAERYPRKGWWFQSTRPNKQFPNGDGHILMKSASDRVGKAIRKAGITDQRITGHSLRHFTATTLVHEGVDIRVVQEILGHASLATTQIYTGVTDGQMLIGIMKVDAPRMPTHARRENSSDVDMQVSLTGCLMSREIPGSSGRKGSVR